MRTCRMALAALAAVAALPVWAAAQSYPYGQTAPGYIAPGGVRPYPYVWRTPTPVRFCRRDAATKQRCNDEFLACAQEIHRVPRTCEVQFQQCCAKAPPKRGG